MNLLLISGGKHPYGETTPVLAGFLKEAGHKVDISESALELAVPSLDGYDAVVLNTLRTDEFGNNLKEGQRENLRKWVEDGGGLVSIHISPASCPDWPEMKKLTGGGWVFGQSHHPPFGRFTMEITDSSHPCATGLSDFRIDDEAYCDLDTQPGIEVFMSTVVEGQERPIAWTHTYGKGKVFNTSLGHAAVSHRNPSFQRHVLNGVSWVQQ